MKRNTTFLGEEKRELLHLVVVGATNGIGVALLDRFCALQNEHGRSYMLTLIGRDMVRLKQLCKRYHSKICIARSLCIDIASKEDIHHVVDFVCTELSKKTLDREAHAVKKSKMTEKTKAHRMGVVYLPGPFLQKNIFDTSYEEWDMLAKKNVVLPSYFVKCLIDQIEQRKKTGITIKGMILLCGATASDGVRGFRNTPAYSALKTALMSVVRSYSLALTEQKKEMCICGVMPGYVDSGSGGTAFKKKEAVFDATVFARLCISLVTQENDILNGAILRADGGFFT